MLRCGTIALVLAAGVASAAAQTPPTTPTTPPDRSITHPPPGTPAFPSPGQPLQLTDAQRAAIMNALRRESPKGASPVNFVASIGAPVPPSIELYVLPDRALAEVPEAKLVKYTMVQNQIVLVDPTTMRVVDVLRQ